VFSVGDVLRAEDAGIVCYSHGAKIAVTWDGGSETELDAEWVFDKVTNVPPPPRSTSSSMCLSCVCLHIFGDSNRKLKTIVLEFWP